MTSLRRRILAGLAGIAELPRRTLMLGGLAAAGLFTIALLIIFAPQPDRRSPDTQAIPVFSLIAKVESLSPEVHLYGRVETPNTAQLTALVTAAVEALHVREGHRVVDGDLLIALDDTDGALLVRRRQSNLVEASANLEALKLAGAEDKEALLHREELHRLTSEKVDRYRQLREQGSISEDALRAVLEEHHAQAIALSRQRRLVLDFEHRLVSAEAAVEHARASLDEAHVSLERTRIRAPFSGRVTRILVAPGELVSPGNPVAEIYDDSALEIRVQIPNAHLPAIEGALAAGDRPAVIAEFQGLRAQGELERLAGAVGSGQSGVDGLVRLFGGTSLPDLGRTVSLKLTLPPVAGVVAVPVQAVYGEGRLFLIRDGALFGIDVERLGATTGADGQPRLLVRSDALKDGVTMLASQLSNAVTGMRVRNFGSGNDDARE